MWTLIGRFGMSLFLREDTPFFFARFFIFRESIITNTFFKKISYILNVKSPHKIKWVFHIKYFIISKLYI